MTEMNISVLVSEPFERLAMIVPATYSGMSASFRILPFESRNCSQTPRNSRNQLVNVSAALMTDPLCVVLDEMLKPLCGLCRFSTMLKSPSPAAAPTLWSTLVEPSCRSHIAPLSAGLGGSVALGSRPVMSAPSETSFLTPGMVVDMPALATVRRSGCRLGWYWMRPACLPTVFFHGTPGAPPGTGCKVAQPPALGWPGASCGVAMPAWVSFPPSRYTLMLRSTWFAFTV